MARTVQKKSTVLGGALLHHGAAAGGALTDGHVEPLTSGLRVKGGRT